MGIENSGTAVAPTICAVYLPVPLYVKYITEWVPLMAVVEELQGAVPLTVNSYGPPSMPFGSVMLHMPVPRPLSTENDMFFVVVTSEVSILFIVEFVRAVTVKGCPPTFR